ncbi:cation diffusion facilitator family transporter [Nitrospirillum amazonense]|uniref:cation diffusion facilitator family transporter n=1 Tax=Nitrospirillum amazonense TaxID=28077 RepID=UPI002412D887|nr:cation diffusion facilitator family transporter [Nitrospirillum amazonense]MDG3440678.1 cation diffusion facilitator family transporter [Nitrospirillum amazonense]
MAPHDHDHPKSAPAQGHDHEHGGHEHGHDHGCTGHDHGHDHHDHGPGGHDHHGHDHDNHDGHDHGHDHDGHGHDHHGHSHGLGGHHHAAPADAGTAFAIGIALNLAYVGAEAFYGFVSNSLALLADAGHNLSDVLGLAASWVAVILARRRPSSRYTYGLGGSSILAALANAVALLLVTGGIAWEAVRRFTEPEPAAPTIMMWVAAGGILVNGGTALLFMRGSEHDLNLRGAFLHLASDALVTLGVVIAGALILWTGWNWLDPVISLVISVVIVLGTWSLLRESLNLALDAVPAGVDLAAVRAYLTALPGVAEVHDLHVWALSTTDTALTAHLVRPDNRDGDQLLAQVCRELKTRFRFNHATVQVETGHGEPCALAPDSVV